VDPKDLEYKELIAKIAADWDHGVDKLKVLRTQCDENIKYGCSAVDFKSRKLEPFMRALSFCPGRGAQTHAKVYDDMLAVLTGPKPDRYNHDEVINRLADDWCSGIDLLRLKYDMATGDARETDDESFGCMPDDFKSNNLNLMYSALEYYEARGYSNKKQHALVYADMLAVLAKKPKTPHIDARCMEDEPGPEDARFGKHDDQLNIYAQCFGIDLGATPARTEILYYNPPGNPTPTFEGTIPMSTTSLSFTTINYVSINGNTPIDLSKLPADNIFSLIEQTEAEIKRLNEIGTKPKALVARIESLQSGIERLVAEVDGRDE
jgi:hypothetical protein